MGSSRKVARAARAVRSPRPTPHEGPCFVDACESNGGMGLACNLCDHEVRHCDGHAAAGAGAIKRHMFLRHPGTLPAWIVSRLRGLP